MPAEHRTGEIEQVTLRERRKLYSLLDVHGGSTWWAPRAIGWWVGILFSIGAILFALGSAPDYFNSVGTRADALTYFLGSIFFTSAAAAQYLQAVNAFEGAPGAGTRQRFRVFAWKPRDLAWLSSLVQLAGTVYFNFSTFRATRSYMFAARADSLVWKPDILGSVCFLVASGLAYREFTVSRRSRSQRGVSWWIVALNLAGSVGFGLSAIAAYVVPTTGQDLYKTLVNLGTFAGALCFLCAAILLLPERTKEHLY
jgi:hypothetical protein